MEGDALSRLFIERVQWDGFKWLQCLTFVFSGGILSPPKGTYDLDDELGHFANDIAVEGLITRVEMGCHWFDGYTDD
jgi:hypothetical protein